MRTDAPSLLPIFRSEMQMRLLALLLLQPECSWTLAQLAEAVDAPPSSVHRELGRAEAAGTVRRNAAARPHLFSAAADDAFYEPLATLLRRSVGVELQLREALDRPDVRAAAIYGSWVTGACRPDSDIDVLVVGDADLGSLRKLVRPISKSAGRNIDLTALGDDEFRRLLAERSSFTRRVMEALMTLLVGDLASVASQ
jgi:predicted nucleotidyltransferase